MSLSLQAVPRYLFPHESVTRETTAPDPSGTTKTTQQIYLRSLNGWLVFGTTTFFWKLEDHAAKYTADEVMSTGYFWILLRNGDRAN